jgi:hypothetical protein
MPALSQVKCSVIISDLENQPFINKEFNNIKDLKDFVRATGKCHQWTFGGALLMTQRTREIKAFCADFFLPITTQFLSVIDSVLEEIWRMRPEANESVRKDFSNYFRFGVVPITFVIDSLTIPLRFITLPFRFFFFQRETMHAFLNGEVTDQDLLTRINQCTFFKIHVRVGVQYDAGANDRLTGTVISLLKGDKYVPTDGQIKPPSSYSVTRRSATTGEQLAPSNPRKLSEALALVMPEEVAAPENPVNDINGVD